MRPDKYVLKLEMSSTEGYHDFLEMLDAVRKDIEGGFEKNSWSDHKGQTLTWEIQPENENR